MMEDYGLAKLKRDGRDMGYGVEPVALAVVLNDPAHT
jgi:hypothetical protein